MPTGIGSGIAGRVFGGAAGTPTPEPLCPTNTSIFYDGIAEKSYSAFDYNLTSVNFSFSFWVKVPDITNGAAGMGIWYASSVDADAFNIYFSTTGVLTAQSINGVDDIVFANSTTIPNNAWTHIVLSANRLGDWKWYVNGVNTTTTDFSTITRAFPSSTGMIKYIFSPTTTVSTGFFSGHTTEFSVWSRALSPAEVLTIYNNMSGDQECLEDLGISNLQTWYRLNGTNAVLQTLVNAAPSGVGQLFFTNMDNSNVTTDIP